MKTRIVSLALLASLAVLGSAKSASADYICTVRYHPADTLQGDFGYISLTTYTAANCGGTLIGSYAVCTTGVSSASSVCSSTSSAYFERHGILAMFGALQRASSIDQKITIATQPCTGGGGSGCFFYATFEAN